MRRLKRALLALLLIFAVFLPSCQEPFEVRERFALPLRFSASTGGNDTVYFVDITKDTCDIEFEESSLLCGAKLHFEENASALSAGDYSFAVEESNFPAFKALIKAIRLLASTQINGEEVENGIKYTIDETVILVYYNKDTTDITGIRTEENGRTFEFTLSDLEPYEAQSNGAGRP